MKIVLLLLPLFFCCYLYPMDLPPLHQAARDGNLAVVEQLANASTIDSRDGEYNSTPLHWAAANGHNEVVKLLLDRGADKEARNSENCTPLHWAAFSGQREAVRLLLDRGANKEARNFENCTPLYWAAYHGQLEVSRLLLERGADINAKGYQNNTPLHVAAIKGHHEVVRLLTLLGADRAAKSFGGKIPADITTNPAIKDYLAAFARTLPYTMNLLIAAAENNIINLKFAIEHGADVNAFNMNGNTALHFAAKNGNWRAILFLLAHGAKPAENFDHETPVHIACRYNHFNIVGLFQMAAAGNATEARNFSQSLSEYMQVGTPQEPPLKRRKIE